MHAHRDLSFPNTLQSISSTSTTTTNAVMTNPTEESQLVWDWDLEHADRKLEAKADAVVHNAPPFQVDRKLLKDIVQEKMGVEVARIRFLGAGTFHKGYLITLVTGYEVVARVARRFMPRLKTDSEIATMQYLRDRTNIPVPEVFHHDSNPWNRLGGEYVIMSKAQGIPLGQVFHSMPHHELIALMEHMASLVIPLFAHRFSRIGSLYRGPDLNPTPSRPPANYLSSTSPTPTVSNYRQSAAASSSPSDFHVGPIVSWPFFGSHRGELSHPHEIDRGPWTSMRSYLMSCAAREVRGVVLENEGKAAPHRLHLDPGEIEASRHHHVEALPGDESDTSDEWDREESEDEWEGPGDSMYRDYRRMQRSTFLVAHLKAREEKVRVEMDRFVRMMERLGALEKEGDGGGGGGVEEFGLDCHDLSLENVFVDENDHSKISCIIDWESTTTRPLWACAHVPTFLQSSPFTAKIFRATVEKMARNPPANLATFSVNGRTFDFANVAAEWLYHEQAGARLRMAHRCIEWDGWEEGLVDSIFGLEEDEDEWFRPWVEPAGGIGDADVDVQADGEHMPVDSESGGSSASQSPEFGSQDSESPTLTEATSDNENPRRRKLSDVSAKLNAGAAKGKQQVTGQVKKVVALEKEREKLLNATGDFCGGRGGELGRRLEAWLYHNGDGDGRVGLERRWAGDEDGENA